MILKYKNRRKPKCILFIHCLILLGLFTSCESGKNSDESYENKPTMSPTAIPSNDSSKDNEVESEPDIIEATEDPKIEDFLEMDTYFIYYTFDVSYDETIEVYQRTYNITGAFDLDGDGKEDRINAILRANYDDGSYIEVNGLKIQLQASNPTGEIHIIDLDTKDDYAEIAIFDDGPSGDPAFSFFRYDGNDLNYLGSIDRYALMDGVGNFISWFHLANNFNPLFFSAWGEFYGGKYVTANHDVEQYIGKTYEVNGTGFFVPLDKNPENYFEYTVWDHEAMREFKAIKIKLIDIYISPDDRTLNWFYVELPDGERGLLYFWIGD